VVDGPSSFACPCCAYLTLDREPGGTFDLCPVCFWEDDPIQFDDHDYNGGANKVSLNEARNNFIELGASEQRFLGMVRPPLGEEMPCK
jgi:hypothetical protein